MCTSDFATTLQNNQSAVTLGLGGLSGALKMTSAMSASGNAATADMAQADAASTNALIAERAAASAITTGQEQASNASIKGAQTIASQQAAMAANGIDISAGGTAANVQASTKWQTTADVNTITANAARAAMGYTQQSTNYANQAGVLTAAANRNSPLTAGFTSLLGSATDVASNWYRNQRAGVN